MLPMRRLTLAVCWALVGGCDPSPPPARVAEPLPAAVVLVPPTATVVDAEQPAPLPVAPLRPLEEADDLRLPSDPTCSLRAATMESVALRLAPDKVPFASVQGVRNVRVHATNDPVGTGLFFEVEKDKLSIVGIAPVAEVPVYLARPAVLGGIFLPSGSQDVRIAGAKTGALLLEPSSTPYHLRDLTMKLQGDATCRDVSLHETRFDPRTALGKAIATSHLSTEAVPLSLAANGEPVATLVPGPSRVEILERAAGAARIAWRVDEGLYTGWVPESHLGSVQKQSGTSRGGFRAPEVSRVRGAPERRVCDHDVALGVVLGDDARFVGRLRAGMKLDLYAPIESATRGISFPDEWITRLNGARFFVRDRDVADCKEVREPDAGQRQPSFRRVIRPF